MKRTIERIFSYLIALGIVCACVGMTGMTRAYADSRIPQDISESELSEPGVLKVGMEANYAPYNWSQTNDDNGAIPISNSQGEYANGYDVCVAKMLAEKLGVKCEIVKMEWDGLSVALQSGKIDAIIAGMTPTPERRQEIDFTDPYYFTDMVLVVQKKSPLAKATSLADFKGARVTGQLNTIHYKLIDQIPDVDKQVAMSDFPTMISSLISGKIDSYVSERPGAMAAVAANSDLTFVSFKDGQGFDTNGVETASAVGLRKGSKLAPYINEVLKDFTKEKQAKVMKDMVDLNQREQHPGFIDQVASIWKNYHKQFLLGTVFTVIISFISTFIGFLIGLLIAIYQTITISANRRVLLFFYRVFDWVIRIYVAIFRGTPMMVQAMLIFYGSKLIFDLDLSPLTSAFLIVSINSGAYLSETVRGGILGVDKGQLEGAQAIGLSHWDTMVRIILPQAVISILPSVGNELNMNIKDTSVLNVIAVSELFFVAKSIAGTTYLTFQTYLIVSVIYFILTFIAGIGINMIEKYLVNPMTTSADEA